MKRKISSAYQILDDIERQDLPGLQAILACFVRTLAIADQLILPLHGAPLLVGADAVEARQAINQRLDRFIKRGREDGSIGAAVNAADIIVFGAMITQPLPHAPSGTESPRPRSRSSQTGSPPAARSTSRRPSEANRHRERFRTQHRQVGRGQ